MSYKKPKCLTLHEKSLVIQELKYGGGVTHLAKKYGVAKSTICKIKQKREMISAAVRDTYVGPGKRQTLKSSEFPRMERNLYKWFVNQRNKNLIVNGEMIKQKAKLLHSQIRENEKQFGASDGWLQRFKKRFGIRFLKISGEKLSPQPELVEPFKIQLRDRIAELGITLDQLYNAAESGLYWKLLPDKVFVSVAEEIAAGRKTERQRVKFLACTNATGTHKVKPLVIGKDAKSRSLTNFNCPVDYKHSKWAWMTAAIFKQWFHYSFIPQVKKFQEDSGLPIKALLLLGNAPCHSNEDELKSEDGQIVTMYVPHNVTPLTQSMDLNVIGLTKLHYRNSLLSIVLESDTNVSDALQELTIKDAVINLMAAWNHLHPEIITKCWRNILDGVVSNLDEYEDVPLAILKRQCVNEDLVPESLEFLRTLAPEAAFEESDVLEWNQCDNDFEGDDIEECHGDETVEKDLVPLNKISLDSAISALNLVAQWAEETDVDYTDLIVIKKLREKAVMQRKRMGKNKQMF